MLLGGVGVGLAEPRVVQAMAREMSWRAVNALGLVNARKVAVEMS